MTNFDLSQHHSLLEALDQTGRRVFGADWTGSEPWARRIDDPARKKAEQKAVYARIADLDSAIRALDGRLNFSTDETDRKKAREEYLSLTKQAQEARVLARHHNYQFDSWDVDFAAYERRQKVEKLMLSGLDSGELTIVYRGGRTVRWEHWRHQKTFRVYLSLSLIRIPWDGNTGLGVVGSDRDSLITATNPCKEPRRFAAFVAKDEFQLWVSKHQTDAFGDVSLTAEEQCRVMLRQLVDSQPSDRPIKKTVRHQSMDGIPGLSASAFNRVWAAEAPPEWQASGRRRGS